MKSLPRSDSMDLRLLHISDFHVEMSEGAMRRLAELLPEMSYDVCVLTGDYRSATFGPFDAALEGPRTGALASQGPSLRRIRKSRYHPHGSRARRDRNQNVAQRMREHSARGSSDLFGRHRRRALIIASTTSKRLHPKFPTTDSQSSCHTRQKYTARLHMPDSICF